MIVLRAGSVLCQIYEFVICIIFQSGVGTGLTDWPAVALAELTLRDPGSQVTPPEPLQCKKLLEQI